MKAVTAACFLFVCFCFNVFGAGPKVAPNYIVYITKYGNDYHMNNCQYLWNSGEKIKIAEAVAKGYKACSVCKPPTEILIQQKASLKTIQPQATQASSKQGALQTTTVKSPGALRTPAATAVRTPIAVRTPSAIKTPVVNAKPNVIKTPLPVRTPYVKNNINRTGTGSGSPYVRAGANNNTTNQNRTYTNTNRNTNSTRNTNNLNRNTRNTNNNLRKNQR
ncbi:hypothetical protein LLG95_11540 [bacterium]|nr:hypothetical protein [bacterium]